MNDIHALLTGPGGLTAGEVAASVAEIGARTRRPLARTRMITAEVTEDRHGMPAAQVNTDGTVVAVRQHGPGLLIQVTTRDAAEAAVLVVTVDGRIAGRSPGPVADRARPGRPRRPGTGKANGLPASQERKVT